MATATMRLGLADHGRAMNLDDYLDAEPADLWPAAETQDAQAE